MATATRKPRARTTKAGTRTAGTARKAAAPKKRPVAKRPAAKRSAAPATARAAATTTTTPTVVDVGKRAPAFSLSSGSGDKVALKDFLGERHVVLYFYPKDNTPGCTKEACAFRDRSREMKRLGVVVLGMSPDSVESHAKFAGKFDLNFPLLSDPGAAVAKKYQVWKEKSLYGRKFMGIERSTFLIGRDGKVKRVWRKVKVAAHDDEVVEALKELRAAR